LEIGIITKQSLLNLSIREDIVDICRTARDGSQSKMWRWFAPSLEAVILKSSGLGTAISENFYSSERGAVKSTGRGFWFVLQMNGLGLLLLYAPSAQRNNSFGYGFKLFPEGAKTVDQRGIRTDRIPHFADI
jgi:hypothetical protein